MKISGLRKVMPDGQDQTQKNAKRDRRGEAVRQDAARSEVIGRDMVGRKGSARYMSGEEFRLVAVGLGLGLIEDDRNTTRF